jgi:hypothetical protein
MCGSPLACAIWAIATFMDAFSLFESRRLTRDMPRTAWRSRCFEAVVACISTDAHPHTSHLTLAHLAHMQATHVHVCGQPGGGCRRALVCGRIHAPVAPSCVQRVGQHQHQHQKRVRTTTLAAAADAAAAAAAVGIDLGTTSSVVAVLRAGERHPTVVTDPATGAFTIPSVVAFARDTAAPAASSTRVDAHGHHTAAAGTSNAAVLVGAPAKAQAASNPANTFYSVKRLMGRRSAEVQHLRLLYETTTGAAGAAAGAGGEHTSSASSEQGGAVRLVCPAAGTTFAPEEVRDALMCGAAACAQRCPLCVPRNHVAGRATLPHPRPPLTLHRCLRSCCATCCSWPPASWVARRPSRS